MTPEEIKQLDQLLKLAKLTSTNTELNKYYSMARITLSEEYSVIA